jgi:2-polyprenyl-3-methyl-5-hydroxy-6-metoxy-1,4-benzoquinol methylase
MRINLEKGKYKSGIFPFRFFDNDAEWVAYAIEFPEVIDTAVEDIEDRFKGNSTEVFAKAIEYIPRSLIGRPYQYWIAHRLIGLMNEENKGIVLDYGCGAGNMGMIFANAGFTVDFAEVKGVITNFLEWRIKKHFLKSKVYTHEDDLGENKYDLVCMQNVMEHLEKPLEVLQKLTRAIKQGGYFLITCNTSGKGLDVVSQETIDKVLMPYLLSNFNKIPETDDMLYQKK